MDVPPEEYLEALRSGDDHNARRFARERRAEGATPSDLLRDLVAPAQVEVGERWYRGEWSVADEHVATAVSERVVSALVNDHTVDGHGPLALVCCVEGERHSLPARLVAEALRMNGWRVVYTGASTPTDHLRDFARGRPPDLIVLSCTMAMNLPSLAMAIASVRDNEVPIAVGGAGVRLPVHAARLGADVWTGSADDLVETLEEGLAGLVRTVPRPPSAEAVLLGHRRYELSEASLRDALRSYDRAGDLDTWTLVSWREQVTHALGFLEAALLVDDESIFFDFVDWWRGRPPPQPVVPALLALSLDAIRDRCDSDQPATSAMLRAGATRLRTPAN